MRETDEFVFMGRHDKTLDLNNSFTMPEEWRFGIDRKGVVYILLDKSGRCLNLVPGVEMERMLATIRAKRKMAPADFEMLKTIGEASYRIVVDDDWRIGIPQRLREAVGITDEVALIGSVLTIKIWAKCMVGSL